jgi:hypothetical protein
MQGNMPPFVMESIGACVRKVQLIARQPLEIRKKIIIKSASPLITAEIRKNENIIPWVNFRLPVSPSVFFIPYSLKIEPIAARLN